MRNDIHKLNFKVLLPMYDSPDEFDSICEQADYYGMDSLTEDEQYYLDSYHRLDRYVSSLSKDDYDNLSNAVSSDNKDVINHHMSAEINVYKDYLKNKESKISNREVDIVDYSDDISDDKQCE